MEKAIENNRFATWQQLTTKRVQNLLPDSTETAKEHPKRKQEKQHLTKSTLIYVPNDIL